MGETAQLFLINQIWRLPVLAIYLAAIGLAVVRRPVLGWNSWLTAVGAAVWLIAWIGNSLLVWWQMTAVRQGTSAYDVGFYSGLIQPALIIVSTVGTGLVVAGALQLGGVRRTNTRLA